MNNIDQFTNPSSMHTYNQLSLIKSSTLFNMPLKKTTQQQSPTTPDFTSLSQEEVKNLLSDLYKNFEVVRNFIDLRMTGNSEPLVKKYKKLIKNRLIEDIEEGTDGLDEALRAVRDFSEYDPSTRDQADIMLHFVESAMNCLNDYGDLYEEFYDETDDMFLKTLKFIKNHQLLDEFRNRCKKVMDDSENMGYGLHDSMGDTYYTFFPGRERNPGKIMRKPVPMKPIKKIQPGKPRKQ